jgi:Ni2+-binding GTPase involved in maturation of urease and hydrogenase
MRARFVLLGGFLGAGKTTAIARLARMYQQQGKRVAIVTNDQAHDLVDTHTLRQQGFQVGEVPGACFCCKFSDLVGVASQLSEETAPDLVLAEPVGSCTDLAATVIEPLRHLYGEDYDVAPFAVLLKPEHGRKILRNEASAGFSPKAAYIFLKQLEEADVIGMNKIDKLDDAQRTELLELVAERFPEKQVLAVSGRTGAGFESLFAALEAPRGGSRAAMDVDYDTYAEGEAELGWLNCQAKVQAANSSSFALDQLVVTLVDYLREILTREQAEPAHLKVYAAAGEDAAVANVVDSEGATELSLASEVRADAAQLVINARVAGAPEMLESAIHECLTKLATKFELATQVEGVQRFRPGRPVPTHRYSSPGEASR